MSLEKSIKVLNLLDLNKTDIVKDVFIIPTDDLQKKKHLVEKKCWHCKNQLEFWKKDQNIIPR